MPEDLGSEAPVTRPPLPDLPLGPWSWGAVGLKEVNLTDLTSHAPAPERIFLVGLIRLFLLDSSKADNRGQLEKLDRGVNSTITFVYALSALSMVKHVLDE